MSWRIRTSSVTGATMTIDGGRPGQVARAPPDPRQRLQLGPVGTDHEVPALQVLRGGRAPARLDDAVELLGCERPVLVEAHVAPRADGVPGLHAMRLRGQLVLKWGMT